MTSKSPAEIEATIKVIRVRLETEKNNRVKNELLLNLIEEAKIAPIHKIGPLDPLCQCLRLLFVDKEQAIRSQAFRVMRYLIKDVYVLEVASKYNIELFISRSLERDSKFLWERMQALKLVRHIMIVDPTMMTRSIVQSLVSIAEHPKDDFRRVCLDALRELVLITPEIVASCNGIKTIVNSILDPTCQDIAKSLTMTLLLLLDQDSTRCYLRSSLILKLLSVFTDTNSPNNREKEERRAAAHKALVTIMRSWTGILCLTSKPNGLGSLIHLLGLPSTVKGASRSREAIFDLLFEIMHVVRSEELRLAREKNVWGMIGPNLLHSYIVIVLFAFMDCGLIQILTILGMSGDKEFSGVATNLLTEILRLSSDLLPRSMCSKLNALPSVIMKASSFESDVSNRVRAVNMVLGLSHGTTSGAAQKTRNHVKAVKLSSRDGSFSPYNQGKGGKNRKDLAQIAITHGINIELIAMKTHLDPIDIFENSVNVGVFSETYEMKKRTGHFVVRNDGSRDSTEQDTMLRKSMVLSGKDCRLWDFNVCLQLLSGPLTNSTNLSKALQTKFIKRLISFLKPSKNIFASLAWTVPDMLFVRVACQLFRVMLGNSDGREYPYFTELIDEIVHMVLVEVPDIPNVGKPLSIGKQPKSRSSILDPSDLEDGSTVRRRTIGKRKTPKSVVRQLDRSSSCRLMREYFTLLGILSSSEYGLQVLEANQFFEHIFNLCNDWSQDYICRLLVVNLDYTQGNVIGPHGLMGAKAVVRNWLKKGSLNLRRCIISHLRILLRNNNQRTFLYKWIIELLVQQITEGNNRQISLDALSVLEEGCQHPRCLDELISHKPDFKTVEPAANRLKLRFLSIPSGFAFLNSIGWIEPQLRYWRSGKGNQRYVETLESALVSALNAGVQPGSHDKNAAATTNAVSESVFCPTGTPGQQPWSGSKYVRSEADDYLFSRIHQLPWSIEVKISNPKSRAVLTSISEAFVHTSYASEEEGGGLAIFVVGVLLDYEGQPKPHRISNKTVTIKARLSIGDGRAKVDGGGLTSSSQTLNTGDTTMSDRVRGNTSDSAGDDELRTRHREFKDYSAHYFSENSKDSEKACTPEDRKGLSKNTPVIILDNVRWYFRILPNCGSGGSDTQELESVWFRLPTPGVPMSIVSPAPHLYGELAKTEAGCHRLRATGHFRDFIDIIKSQSSSIQKRATLWALGQIGSSELGFQILRETDIVEYISDQAKNCHTLSMRGTCFYILGLLSCTRTARRLLESLGWQMPPNPHVGVVIPQLSSSITAINEEPFNYLSMKQNKDKDGFLSIPDVKYIGSWAKDAKNTFGVKRVPSKGDKGKEEEKEKDRKDPVHRAQTILGHISNLCNHVTQKSSLQALRQIRGDQLYKPLFASTLLLFETLKLLGSYTYRLPARRFILFDLFNMVIFNKETMKEFDRPFEGDSDSSLSKFANLDVKKDKQKKQEVMQPKSPKLLKK